MSRTICRTLALVLTVHGVLQCLLAGAHAQDGLVLSGSPLVCSGSRLSYLTRFQSGYTKAKCLALAGVQQAPGESPEVTTADGIGTQQDSTSVNPLLASGPFLLWDQIKPNHIESAVRQLIAEESASFDYLEVTLNNAANVTFDTVFLPLTQIRLRLDSVYNQIEHLQYVTGSNAIYNQVDKITPVKTAFELRIKQSKPIYTALVQLNGSAALTPPQQWLVQRTLLDLQQNGVGLPADKKGRLSALDVELQGWQNGYNDAFVDSLASFKLIVRRTKQQPKPLDGMPDSAIAAAASNAVDAKLVKVANTTFGPWVLRFDGSSADAVLTYANDQELRRKVFVAQALTATRGKMDNSNAVRNILALRREKALLLGYNNFAEMRFAQAMATPSAVNAVLNDLINVSTTKAQAEDDEVVKFARNTTGNPALQLLPWDWQYWRQRCKQDKFKVDEQQLRQYLQVEGVKQGLFKMARRAYNIDIQPAAASGAQVPVWNKDVETYFVYNIGSNTPLGLIYLDLYARPGQKSVGGWTQPLIDAARFWRSAGPASLLRKISVPTPTPPGKGKPGRGPRAASNSRGGGSNNNNTRVDSNNSTDTNGTSNGTSLQTMDDWLRAAPMQMPVVAVVLNQAPPANGQPAVMWLDDVLGLFHEFAHALQQVLSTTDLGLASGLRNTEIDAAEIVAMFQEKMMYDGPTFSSFSDSMASLLPMGDSDTLLQVLLDMFKFGQGNFYVQELIKTVADLRLHTEYGSNGSTLSPEAIYASTYQSITPPTRGSLYPGSKPLNTFEHIFSGLDYEAVYYSYIWSDLHGADIYFKFQEASNAGDAAFSAVGQAFRDTFYALAGSLPTAEVFKSFMGRGLDSNALMEYYGLQ